MFFEAGQVNSKRKLSSLVINIDYIEMNKSQVLQF